MIGFIVITHNRIGTEILATIQDILQELPHITSIEVKTSSKLADTQQQIREAIASLPSEVDGIILLADLFGATPCNLCQPFLKPGQVEMITGCNLPMILKAATGRFEKPLDKVGEFLTNYAKENIRICSQ